MDIRVHPGWQNLISSVHSSPKDLYVMAGLPANIFSKTNYCLSQEQLNRLWGSIEEVTSCDELPLQMVQSLSFDNFDSAIFASLCCRDLNSALVRVAQFKQIISIVQVNVLCGEKRTKVEVGLSYNSLTQLRVPVGTMEIVFLTHLARIATQKHITPTYVSLIEKPKNITPYEDFFGTSVNLGDINRLEFSAADGKLPFTFANEKIWDFFEPKLNKFLIDTTYPSNVSSKVRRMLLEMLPSGESSLAEVADRLSVSKRTLHRQLNKEGSSYFSLLQNVREDLANYYLISSNIGLSEVSFLLGFKDSNSFCRAYSQWTGLTPGQFRQKYKNEMNDIIC